MTKSNLTAEGVDSLIFQTVDDPKYHVASIDWREATGQTAEEMLRAAAEHGRQPARGEAVGILRGILEQGARPVSEVKELIRDAGVAWRTAERAKEKLHVEVTPIKDATGRITPWSAPRIWRWRAVALRLPELPGSLGGGVMNGC